MHENKTYFKIDYQSTDNKFISLVIVFMTSLLHIFSF